MKVAIYARFSSDNQREESITAQLRAASDYCKKHGYEIVKEYIDEAFSARTDDRPAFQQMISDAQKGIFELLITYKIDRFARNRYDAAFYKRILLRSGVKVIYTEQKIDDSPESVILESVLEGMAEYFSKNLSKEVKKGMRENALQAKHNGGTPPLGYDVAPDKTYQINEDEAVTIRRIFRDYAKGKSLAKICLELNEAGIKTKRGSAFGKNSLHDLLKNPKYIGQYAFGRSSTNTDGKRNGRNPSKEIIVLENAIPSIIEKETWDKVQSKFRKNVISTKEKGIYLFSGLLRCSCGSTLVGNRYQGRTKEYSYYRCNNSTRTGQCKSPKFQKEPLEAFLLEKIFPMIFSEDNAKLFLQSVNEKIAIYAQENLSHIKTLEKEKKSSESKIESLLCIAESGNAPTSILDRIRDNENIIKVIEKQLKKIKTSIQKVTLTEDQLLQIFENLQKEKEPVAIKLLVHTLVDSILINPDQDELKIIFKIDSTKYGVTTKNLGSRWWRRGESNPCPEIQSHRFLRVQSIIKISDFFREQTPKSNRIFT